MSINSMAKTILGVKNCVVESVAFHKENNEYIIQARPTTWHMCECGVCGHKSSYYDAGQGRRRWRCTDIGTVKCFVEADAFRVMCPNCGVKVRKLPWAAHDSWFTYAFEQTCCWLALNMSKSACANLMRVQWSTIDNICTRVESRLEKKRTPVLDNLVRIGVDETSYKKGHKYMTVIVNHDTGAVVWCADGHGRKIFDSFFEQLSPEQRAKIELVSGDGARWIDEAIAQWCPQAARCVDTFHVVSWATDALDEVRRQIWREANGAAKDAPKRKRGRPKVNEVANPEKEAAQAVKGLRYPLLKNPENLTEKQLLNLEMTAISNPRLYRAYLLKEQLRLTLKLPAEEIEEALMEWRGKAWRSRIPEFVQLQKKIKRHMKSLISTASSGITNARVESVNNSIKLLVRMAYGYRNFENLRAMIMLKHSGLQIELPGRENASAKRKRAA